MLGGASTTTYDKEKLIKSDQINSNALPLSQVHLKLQG